MTLFLILGFFWMGLSHVDKIYLNWIGNDHSIVEIKKNTSQVEVEKLKDKLTKLLSAKVEIQDSKKNIERLKEKNKNFKILAKDLDIDLSQILPTTLKVSFQSSGNVEKELDSFKKLKEFTRSDARVSQIYLPESHLRSLSNFYRSYKNWGFSFLIWVCFTVVIIHSLLVSHLLTLHKKEMNIYKLLGISPILVQVPYLIYTFLLSLISFLAALSIIILAQIYVKKAQFSIEIDFETKDYLLFFILIQSVSLIISAFITRYYLLELSDE